MSICDGLCLSILVSRQVASIMIAILYVDDLGLAFPSESVLEDFLTELKRLGFEFTREGTFSEFLGIDFAYDKEGKSVTMTQAGLIGKILATAGMTDCKDYLTSIFIQN